MNEYTEFDTAAEMQKALDRKKAAFGYTEGFEVDENGIIPPDETYEPSTPLDSLICEACDWTGTEQERLAQASEVDGCNVCPKCAAAVWSRDRIAAEEERGRDAWDADAVFDWEEQSIFFREAYEEAWFETVRPNTDGDNCEQAWGHQLDDLYWRFKEQ